MISRGAAGLFLDPGLGKTSATLAAFRLLQRKGMADRMLVIAPLRVCHAVWPAEVAKWSDFAHLRVSVLHGPEKALALQSDADIYVINPEGLDWLLSGGRLKKLGADILVVDESTKFKNTSTKRFKLLRPHLTSFRRRWILTGTPAPNGLLDLFGQVYLMDLGHSFGAYITHFRSTYFIASGYGGYKWTPMADTEARIQEKLKPLVLRLDAEDYLELPERVDLDIMVELPPAARKTYDELEDFLFTTLEDKLVTAMSVAVVGGKCRQVANGAIYKDQGDRQLARFSSERWMLVHDAKLDALTELVEELSGQPLLVLYEFDHDRERLLKRFGKDTACLTGLSGVKLNAVIDAWNRGELPVLLGQPQSMGHGLNLQGSAAHVAWFGLPWDLEVYDQAVKRVHRSGNPHKRVFVHHLVVKDSIEQDVKRALQGKSRTQTALLDSLKKSPRRNNEPKLLKRQARKK